MDDLHVRSFQLEEENKQLLKEIQCREAKLIAKEEEVESAKRKLKSSTELCEKLLKTVVEFLLRYGLDDEDDESLIEEYLQFYNITREKFKEKFRPKDDEADREQRINLWTRVYDLVPSKMLKELEIDDPVKLWI